MSAGYSRFRSPEFPVTCLICHALVDFSRKEAHTAWHNEGSEHSDKQV